MVECEKLLRETFRAYVAAEGAAASAFLGYKFGEVSEAEVRRLNRAASVAKSAHLAAMGGQ